MLLHAGSARDSCAALHEVRSCFAELPGARLIHLQLQEKGEPTAADLCERLALADTRHVATFSLDDPKQLRVALDGLLTRLAP